MIKENVSDIEEFFDCMDDFEEIKSTNPWPVIESSRPSDFKKSLDSKKENVLKSITSHESFKQYKTISTDFFMSLPKVLKFEKKKKLNFEFQDFRMIQEVNLYNKENTDKWILKFSKDSKYLCVAGKNIVSLYEISTTNPDSLVMFKPTPSVLSANSEITCIAWTVDSFLLSGSVDGIVCKWKKDSEIPVKIFEHCEDINAIESHPTNSQIFITACADCIIRLYINDEVVGYYQTTTIPTVLAYDSLGERVAVGLNKGEVMIYQTYQNDKLRLKHTILCKNSKGIYSKGRKVCGVAIDGPYVLISTNDSRIRVYHNEVLLHKYKGHKCNNLQLPISFNEDKSLILSGSQNGKIYIWNSNLKATHFIKFREYEALTIRKHPKNEFAMFLPDKVLQFFRTLHKYQSSTVKNVIISVGSKDTLKIFANLT